MGAFNAGILGVVGLLVGAVSIGWTFCGGFVSGGIHSGLAIVGLLVGARKDGLAMMVGSFAGAFDGVGAVVGSLVGAFDRLDVCGWEHI